MNKLFFTADDFKFTDEASNNELADIANEKITPLLEKLERYEKALQFYADSKSYESKDINRNTGNKVYDILLFDFTRNYRDKKDYAGKTAREALGVG